VFPGIPEDLLQKIFWGTIGHQNTQFFFTGEYSVEKAPRRSFEKDLPGHHGTPYNPLLCFLVDLSVPWCLRRSFCKDLVGHHETP
jgi:hypothetical protein